MRGNPVNQAPREAPRDSYEDMKTIRRAMSALRDGVSVHEISRRYPARILRVAQELVRRETT